MAFAARAEAPGRGARVNRTCAACPYRDRVPDVEPCVRCDENAEGRQEDKPGGAITVATLTESAAALVERG